MHHSLFYLLIVMFVSSIWLWIIKGRTVYHIACLWDTHTHVYIHEYTSICTHIWICIHLNEYVCVHTSVSIWIYIYVYIHRWVYINLNIYVYTHTHSFSSWSCSTWRILCSYLCWDELTPKAIFSHRCPVILINLQKATYTIISYWHLGF